MPRSAPRLPLPPLNVVLPAVGLAAILAVIFSNQPSVASYFGLNLLLSYAMPLILVSMAQLCVIAAGDIDLSIGPFTSMITCITSTVVATHPLFGLLALVACVLAYMVLGALIHIRRLPSIVATLGASFVWLGIALTILPTPGGACPPWLATVVHWHIPDLPMPILVAVVVAAVGDLIFMRSAYGAVLRGFGANPQAIARAGWSPLTARVTLYGLAGVFGVLGGLFMTALNTTGDANVGAQYTLLSIAAVIIGGGEFSGGIISPVGAVIGALIMLLTGSLLSFENISPNWQLSAQGALLVLVLSLKRVTRRRLG
jgi:ribose/xylose/arabinose/galactoside ABC-type transport system permease subunit